MDKLGIVFLSIIGLIGLIFGLSLLFAWPLMLLWNWVMVSIFSLPVIGFWKSWGLLMLSGLLFKSSSVNTSNK